MDSKANSFLSSNSMEDGFCELDEVVFKHYLEKLNLFPVIKNPHLLENVARKTRLNQVSKIVYDREENNLGKLSNVFSSMASHNSSVFVLLCSDSIETKFYIGTQSLGNNDGHLAIEVFERSLQASFPGIETKDLFADDVRTISNNISSSENRYITSVSGIPSLKDSSSDNFVQGLEKIVEGMQGKKYTALLLATPVLLQELEMIERSYQEIYSSLSFMESQQLTLSENESATLGKTLGTSLSNSLSNTMSKSASGTFGTSKTNTTGTNHSSTKGKSSTYTQGVSVLVASSSYSSTSSKSETYGSSQSHSQGESESKTLGSTNSKGSTDTSTTSETNSISATTQIGSSHQYTFKNRRITDILELIDEQLIRIRECKNHGMWNFGTYFIDSVKSSTQMGANLLSGILCGEKTGVERKAILSWDADELGSSSFASVCESLSYFTHPVFDVSSKYPFGTATPTSLVSASELAVGLSLPQKSLPGIPVFESVDFGRTVSSFSEKSSKLIDLGVIQHLGKNYPSLKVELDVNSLSSHLFVTGSTGAGKSNAVYSIVYKLWKTHNIPFLIIEPAKGEYKDVFGGYKRVSTFGTNCTFTPLLRMNPFSFPKEIHVTEHIDRLIEILNAAWPMYAAMPAILKSSIEQAYERIGWNLFISENAYGQVFPDFADLLEVLPSVIEKSSYSTEVKGNYIGALVARIESLTNGYYRSIFQKDELENSVLFDAPCIVDLSRVGSSETKSLLMGILFMKLQEYRMSSTVGCNTALKHVTVIEEAHNLIRRTSLDQSGEGANLQGKAVEMITNAIAEMRTHGEGFIIADQSPGLLDQAVIRNTNTKMILRLPDWEDRNLVGKSANLKENHIDELARLRTGCAAVYQNNWQEAVLCQIDEFDMIEKAKSLNYSCTEMRPSDSRVKYRTELINILIMAKTDPSGVKVIANKLSLNLNKIKQYYPEVLTVIDKKKNNPEWLLSQIEEVLGFEQAVRLISSSSDLHKWSDRFYDWTTCLLKNIFANFDITMLDNKMQNEIILSTFEIATREHSEGSGLWLGEMGKVDMWRDEIC
ncbi:ATP-binding protein [Maridesulfovibrio ferrireducens]|uniref:ATP-binding protein n=1 Tax=Maridesulfovibrio ferrireducens TaxID=246191 RepID=UPI001A235FCC|nr:ATP-binding protein [Maridesulfovibrio ferrireducens]MBI9109964.1 ATP-binding protein [Maridesulfovibrio ferrireducens]